MGLWVARHGWLYQLLAAVTIVGEISAPLAVVSRVACRVLIPGLFMMQVAIYVLMGTGFKEFMVVLPVLGSLGPGCPGPDRVVGKGARPSAEAVAS